MNAAASQAASADPGRGPRHVAVVGAGLAGLAAAWKLQGRGYRVSVLEAARRVGGRHATESLDGWRYEPGPQLIPTRSPQLAALARALGARQSLLRFPLQCVLAARRRGLAVVDLGRGLSLRVRPRLSWRATRLPDVLAWLGAALDSAAPESGARLDDRSVADWLRLYLGSRIHDEVFEPLLEGLLGLESTDTSRVVLVPLLDAQGAPEVSLAFGVGPLIERMAAELVGLRTHTRVERIAADGRVLRTADGETLHIEATVLATPGAEDAAPTRSLT